MWRFACPPCCFGPHVEVLDDSMLIAEDSSSRPWGVFASKSRMAPKKYNIHQLHKCLCSDGLPRHQPKILLCEVHVFMSQRVIYNTYHITMIKIQQVMKLPIKTKKHLYKKTWKFFTTSGIRFTTSGIRFARFWGRAATSVATTSCDVRCKKKRHSLETGCLLQMGLPIGLVGLIWICMFHK